MESILSESEIDKRAMVEGNENSTDVCKRTNDRRIFAEIAPNKNIAGNRKFRRKEVRHMLTHCKVLENQILVVKSLKHGKHQMF